MSGWRAQVIFLSAAWLALVGASEPSEYCVRPIPVQPAADVPSNIWPQSISLPQGGRYPFVSTTTGPDTHGHAGQYWWTFDGSSLTPAATWHDAKARNPIVLDDDDTLLVKTDVKAKFFTDASGVQSPMDIPANPRIVTSFRGSVPEESPLDAKGERGLFPSAVLGGAIAADKDKATLITSTGSRVLTDRWLSLAVDLPALNSTALLDFSHLMLAEPGHEPVVVTPLNSGDDYNGWDAVHETADPAWIYVSGAQYDHAIHLENFSGMWRATSIVRFKEFDDDPLSRFLGWMMNMDEEELRRDHLSTLIETGKCRRFSPALRRMIFCDDMLILKEGALIPIPGGDQLAGYRGDSIAFGVALFRTKDGSLAAFDGTAIHPIANTPAEPSSIHDMPEVGRTFLTAESGMFELVRGDIAFSWKQLDTPPNFGPGRYVAIVRMPDASNLVAFTRPAIFVLRRSKVEAIWTPPPDETMGPSAPANPTPAAAQHGILFATGRKVADDHRTFYFLSACSH